MNIDAFIYKFKDILPQLSETLNWELSAFSHQQSAKTFLIIIWILITHEISF
jgi:hypothetical protein